MNKTKIPKDILYFIVILTLAGGLIQSWITKNNASIPNSPTAAQTEVYYNKDTELNLKLIELIQNSNEYIYFGIYTFTRYDIKDALLGAKHRGVNIIGVTDKEQIKSIPNQASVIKQLRDAGIPVYVQDHSAIMHLKILITENAYASGSYNWTASATDRNDEVLEIGTDPQIRDKYKNILEEIFEKYKNAK